MTQPMDQAMETVEVRQQFAQPAGIVWVLTGEFGGLKNWLPGVEACTVTGSGPRDQGGNAERSVKLVDGSVTRESLESRDEAAMCYEYAILEAKDFQPDQTFKARFQVQPLNDERCEIIWSASFSVPHGLPDEKVVKLRARVEQMYRFFLTHLVGQLQ